MRREDHRWALASALGVIACGPAPERHVWGGDYVPADSIGGIDLDDADASTSVVAPASSEAGSDPEPASSDGDPGDEGVGDHDAPPPALETGDDGAPATSPYTGGWDIGDCQGSIVSTGTNVGGVVPDFLLGDQFGDQVRLYDFCHKAVFLTAGAFW